MICGSSSRSIETQEMADARDAVVVLAREEPRLLAVRPHGAELENRERLAAVANARLAEKDGAAIVELDGKRDQQPDQSNGR